ncbi:glycosyltransferase family 2 protein, partial [Jatrophihabitans sp.]|uniref:glycosyltransferase family 2 protein n=1 Tax=Jatrophihabitans sp. TaxID=1932789 RepID=UPI0030C761C1|nr:glycosyl transferase group 1 [Jatrophihabitans sp.]
MIVAYGAPHLLSAAVAALDPDEDVTVVDNSRREDVRAAAGGAHYVRPPGNLGFSGGVNAGLAALRARDFAGDVLLLNPDARLDSVGITRLQDALLAQPRTAAVAPQRLRHDGADQQVLWPLPSPSGMWREAVGLPRRGGPHFAVGAVLLLRAEALAEIGGFDETFPLYAEESDWQRRAQEAGWQIALADGVEAAHVGAGTSTDDGLRERLFAAAQETYLRRWFGASGWLSYRLAAVLGAALRGLLLPGARGAAARARRAC